MDRIDKDSIKVIVECGSRDCLDAIALHDYYNPRIVYSFECNPECIVLCGENLQKNERKNIKLITKAIYDKDAKDVNFYATDMINSEDKNIGGSSLLFHRDQKKYIQKKILVNCMRLDTFMTIEKINKIDLLCMDLQGAEYLAIRGFGDRSKDIKYIITEISYHSYYHGDRSFWHMKSLLEIIGFVFLVRIGNNALFKNKR
jgi:FkbM family methyltransferase